MKDAFKTGDRVEVKRVGLGRRWEQATVVEDDDGRRVRVVTRDGSELLMPHGRVRAQQEPRSFGGAQLAAARAMLSAERPPEGPAAASRADLLRTERRQIAAAALRAVPKPLPPARDKDHLARVRAMACSWCSAPPPSDPHHYGPHGMGQKCSDLRTVPLCRRCHDQYHDGKLAEDTPQHVTIHFLRTQVDILEQLVIELMEPT